eukprot:526965-Amphidinium_carterae.1
MLHPRVEFQAGTRWTKLAGRFHKQAKQKIGFACLVFWGFGWMTFHFTQIIKKGSLAETAESAPIKD